MSLSPLQLACQPQTFSPLLSGAQILSVQANLVTNYHVSAPAAYVFDQPGVEADVDFCNVTVTYSHDQEDDTLIVEAWLPMVDWNGRFVQVGGGGWVAGRGLISEFSMGAAVATGFATLTTDGGIGNRQSPASWALKAPGVVDMNMVRNFAYVAFGDAAVMGKKLIESFYGKPPAYTYWHGCSQGGREGMAMAQLYPTLYDGIAAGAPALYIPELASSMYWPQQYMNNVEKYPFNCEMDAITLAARAHCDALDGVIDGLTYDPDACFESFDPFSVVGSEIECAEISATIPVSADAARVVNASWSGASAGGRSLWFGLRPGTDLTGGLSKTYGGAGALAKTNCSESGCKGVPTSLGIQWYRGFAAKDPSFDVSSMTQQQFERFHAQSVQEYGPVLTSADPDLSEFRNAGGKIVSFHGLLDDIIPDQGTRNYYKAVSKAFPDVHDFYRYFPVPGLGHCLGGLGGQPTSLFAQLREWVENGTAPDSSPVSYVDDSGVTLNRILCPFPKKAVYESACGDSTAAECWKCVD